MVLLRIFSYLCVSLWTKSTTTAVRRELAPFHVLLAHQIWRPVSTLYGHFWERLYTVSLLTQVKNKRIQSNRQSRVLTKILWKHSTKTWNIVHALCWEKAVVISNTFWTEKSVLLLQLICLIEHPSRLRTIRIIPFNFRRFLPTSCTSETFVQHCTGLSVKTGFRFSPLFWNTGGLVKRNAPQISNGIWQWPILSILGWLLAFATYSKVMTKLITWWAV